jgi:hypothetical protein
VNSVKGVSSYFNFIQVPEDAERESNKSSLGGDVYYWKYGKFEMWETITETATKVVWTVDVDAGTGAGRVKYIEAEEMKDGSSGFMRIYNMETEVNDWLVSYEWSFDAAGNATMLWLDSEGTFKYEVKVNIDESGFAKMYTEGVLFYHFLWNKDGSGSYTYYFDGTSETYTWSVADL